MASFFIRRPIVAIVIAILTVVVGEDGRARSSALSCGNVHTSPVFAAIKLCGRRRHARSQ